MDMSLAGFGRIADAASSAIVSGFQEVAGGVEQEISNFSEADKQ